MEVNLTARLASAFPRFRKIFAPQAVCLAHAQFCFFCLQLRACEAENSKNHLAILRLDCFYLKFTNLSHRDLYLENIKFDSNLRCDGAKFNLRIAQQLITCSGVGDGLGEEGATLRK